jgi:hypothetical protein
MKPIAIRTSGEMRLLSNEYLTKKATARKAASPPIQASSLTPMNCSQLMAGTSLRRGFERGPRHRLDVRQRRRGVTALAATGIGGGAGETVNSSGVIRGGAGCAGAAGGCHRTQLELLPLLSALGRSVRRVRPLPHVRLASFF